jgi:hypothetical protein
MFPLQMLYYLQIMLRHNMHAMTYPGFAARPGPSTAGSGSLPHSGNTWSYPNAKAKIIKCMQIIETGEE